jgi:hypothetical protein
MKSEQQVGILTSIDWNSYQWKKYPGPEDLTKAKYKYVRETGLTHTYLNFACDRPDDEGYTYGLLPQFWSKKPKSKDLKIVFIRSQNWRSGKTFIVGLHLFPQFSLNSLDPLFPKQGERVVNIKVLAENTVLLKNYIELTSANVGKFIPEGKKLGKQGFNYLSKENCLSILNEMILVNPEIPRLGKIEEELD